MQNNKPKRTVEIVLLSVGKVWVSFLCKEEMVAPSMENIAQGNNGYVPVKNKFEITIMIEASATLSSQSPVPWISGKRI